MAKAHLSILNAPDVRAALRQAWFDSKPGTSGGHEEGGFVLRNSNGELSVSRWHKGEQDAINLPPHPACKFGENEIVASFHTHPNTGDDYLQEPSESDKRAVRDDADLKGESYVGEFVISAETIYLITPAGRVREINDTQEYFSEG
jgi:hypothetical protein